MGMEGPTALDSMCLPFSTADPPPNLTLATTRKLENLFSMQGGNGESSYARNSQGQAKHLRSMQPLLEEALDAMELPLSQVFTIADLGCSSGQNTLGIANVIVNHFIAKYKSKSLNLPDFQVFFSDLASNDFNTLFHLLPPMQTVQEDCAPRKPRKYFAAGVPGSFYKRLFPRRSINVVHSSFSLHWLSQVPTSVEDRMSAAWNEGRIFIHGGSEATANAYRSQFQSDFQAFLEARSEEMKSGGCMFLVCMGRTFSDPANQSGAGILFGTHFQNAWNDLVEEGLIEGERRDTFNVPVFAPTVEEFRDVVEREGSFCAEKVEIFRAGSPLVVKSAEDENELGRAFTNSCRSVCGVLVDAHIGKELSEEVFRRMERRATQHAKDLVDNLQFFHVVAVLTRKWSSSPV